MRFSPLVVCAMPVFVALAGPSLAQDEAADAPCSAATLDGYSLTRLVPPEAKGASARQLRAVVRRAVAWVPGETIKVCFKSGTEVAQARVARYAREWMQYANVVLDFGGGNALRKCQGDSSEDIKIDFVDGKGWWSALGTSSRRREHSMNLESYGVDAPLYKSGKPVPEASLRRVVLHEFGHALGMLHEHQSPSAACDNEFDWDKAYEVGARWGWDKKKVDLFFRQLHVDELNMTDIDRKSIMHYALPPEVFKRGKESRCWVAGNFDLSLQDRAFIRTIYPKKDDPVAVSDAPSPSTTRAVTPRAGGKDSGGKPVGGGGDTQALVKDYERLLRQAGVAADKAGQLTEEFRKLAGR